MNFSKVDELWGKVTAEQFEIQTLQAEKDRLSLQIERKRLYAEELLAEIRLEISAGRFDLSQLSPMTRV